MDKHVKPTPVAPFHNLEEKLLTSVSTLLMLQQQLTLLPVLLDICASLPKLSSLLRLPILLVLKFLLLLLLHLSQTLSQEMFVTLPIRTLATKEHVKTLFAFQTMPLELHAKLTEIAELDYGVLPRNALLLLLLEVPVLLFHQSQLMHLNADIKLIALTQNALFLSQLHLELIQLFHQQLFSNHSLTESVPLVMLMQPDSQHGNVLELQLLKLQVLLLLDPVKQLSQRLIILLEQSKIP